MLAGGEPAGGYYTGSGVSSGLFDPAAASTGLNYVYYNYTDSTGCGSSVYDTIVVLLCTDINDLGATNVLSLYPNPCTDYLTVESDLLRHPNSFLSIYDIAGRRVWLNHPDGFTDKIYLNINNLSSGCYWLQLNVEGSKTGKLFIKTD